MCWADIPQLSTRDRRCPVAWQQSRPNSTDSRPSASFQARADALSPAASDGSYPSSEASQERLMVTMREQQGDTKPARRNRWDLDLTSAARPRSPGSRTVDHPRPPLSRRCFFPTAPALWPRERGRASCLAQLGHVFAASVVIRDQVVIVKPVAGRCRVWHSWMP